jgi:hypothetical protein
MIKVKAVKVASKCFGCIGVGVVWVGPYLQLGSVGATNPLNLNH